MAADLERLAREFQHGTKPREITVAEGLVIRERFTKKEKKVLIEDGAVIYQLHGETILGQQEAQKTKEKPSFYYIVDGLPDLPPRQIEVAIYPDPERFFVPDSFNKSVEKQENLVNEDAKNLREKLNLLQITEIIPEKAATLSEITFRHLDVTGVWLFGPEYANAQGLDWVSGRTKNPTSLSGSYVADVGGAIPDYGLGVFGWFRGHGARRVGAVRLVVPIGNK